MAREFTCDKCNVNHLSSQWKCIECDNMSDIIRVIPFCRDDWCWTIRRLRVSNCHRHGRCNKCVYNGYCESCWINYEFEYIHGSIYYSIKSNNLFDDLSLTIIDYISYIISEFSFGASFICCNNKCNNTIMINNIVDFKNYSDSNNNYIYWYSCPKRNNIFNDCISTIYNNDPIRIFCYECSNYKNSIFRQCDIVRCTNKETNNISELPYGYYCTEHRGCHQCNGYVPRQNPFTYHVCNKNLCKLRYKICDKCYSKHIQLYGFNCYICDICMDYNVREKVSCKYVNKHHNYSESKELCESDYDDISDIDSYVGGVYQPKTHEKPFERYSYCMDFVNEYELYGYYACIDWKKKLKGRKTGKRNKYSYRKRDRRSNILSKRKLIKKMIKYSINNPYH